MYTNTTKDTNYYKSGKHVENVLKAREKALAKTQMLKQERIQSYNDSPNRCANCNIALEYEKKRNKFCSSSCAAKTNNKTRTVTEESNVKRSETLIKRRTIERGTRISKTGKYVLCNYCKREFQSTTLRKFCSEECKKLKREERYTPEFRLEMSERQKKLYKEGKLKGWATRDKLTPSYPEQYFITLFNAENVEFEREIKKGRFFVDFIWENIKLILEVDGKQHDYPEHVERDTRKDKFLTSLGYEVFRIKWANPINEKNRAILYDQINIFKDMKKSKEQTQINKQLLTLEDNQMTQRNAG